MTTDDVSSNNRQQDRTCSRCRMPPCAPLHAPPATKPLVFSLSRVLEGRRPQVALCFPSYGHVLVKTALSVAVRPPSGNLTASFVTLERQRQ
jgi:hypothetical protein